MHTCYPTWATSDEVGEHSSAWGPTALGGHTLAMSYSTDSRNSGPQVLRFKACPAVCLVHDSQQNLLTPKESDLIDPGRFYYTARTKNHVTLTLHFSGLFNPSPYMAKVPWEPT